MLANDVTIQHESVIDGRAGERTLPARPAVRPQSPPRSVRRVLFPASATLLALLLAIPIVTVLVSLALPVNDLWWEFVRLMLRDYLVTTAWLMLGVCAGVAIIGVSTAWLVTICRFPGSRIFEYALLLPMAVPAYLLAYTYADLLQFPGPVQTSLRGWFGWEKGDYWFPQIRSLPGAIAMLTFVLYPYVYLLARAAFLHQSKTTLDAGRSLGLGPWRTFMRVALPMARPAIAAGVAIAGMEALADYGTVKHFEVNTLSTAIYLSWFSLGSSTGAAKLASGLLGFVLLVLALERMGRGRQRYTAVAGHYRPPVRYQLRGLRAAGAILACTLPPVIGFAIPAARLIDFAVTTGDAELGSRFVSLARNSLLLASLAAAVTVLIAGLLAYGMRLAPSRLMRFAARVSTLGYAIPGAVIAVGVMLPFGHADNAIDRWMEGTFGISTGLLLSGTIFTLVFAYVIRFLAIAFGSVESGLSRISPSLDEAARTLGRGTGRTVLSIHLPLLRGSILTAALLVFVDTLKELSATLILRPFNFDTLAIRVYQLASDERLAEASTAALAIVAVGLIPVIVLSAAIARSRPAGEEGRP
jgi:iron(III) transport system permease protein